LILFSTRDGQTREIAAYLASELKELGIYSDVVNLNRAEQIAWQDYDRVVIGASIRYGHFHPALDRFVKKHTAVLNKLPARFTRSTWLRVKPRSARRRPTATRASFCSARRGSQTCAPFCRRAALPLSLV
jgi:menaquinone-dependent protoporphyrinogen oxidase